MPIFLSFTRLGFISISLPGKLAIVFFKGGYSLNSLIYYYGINLSEKSAKVLLESSFVFYNMHIITQCKFPRAVGDLKSCFFAEIKVWRFAQSRLQQKLSETGEPSFEDKSLVLRAVWAVNTLKEIYFELMNDVNSQINYCRDARAQVSKKANVLKPASPIYLVKKLKVHKHQKNCWGGI